MIIPKSSLTSCNRIIHPLRWPSDFAVSFCRKGRVLISAPLTLGVAMGLPLANKMLVCVTKAELVIVLVWLCSDSCTSAICSEKRMLRLAAFWSWRLLWHGLKLAHLPQSRKKSFPSTDLRANSNKQLQVWSCCYPAVLQQSSSVIGTLVIFFFSPIRS